MDGGRLKPVILLHLSTNSMRKAIDYPAVGVVFLCHDGAGNVLYGKRTQQARDEQGRWDIGGGGLHVGESLLDSVRREVTEEYCAHIIDVVPLGYREIHRHHEETGEKTHWISFDFAVQVNRDTVAIGEPEKCEEIVWCQWGTEPSPVHSQWHLFQIKYAQELGTILSPRA